MNLLTQQRRLESADRIGHVRNYPLRWTVYGCRVQARTIHDADAHVIAEHITLSTTAPDAIKLELLS